MSLTYTLVRECQNNVNDIAGFWQIEGGKVLEHGHHVANYSNVKRVSCGTHEQNTAMLWITLFFLTPPLENLTLHGAHDIGHALQDLALVGCSSFAAWGDKSEDGSLILGRNFDFYAGDEFAKDKVVAFIKPTKGYPFMMVTWPGMIGAVSGMNNEGLTITINAGKSKVPLIAKTPISILTREILQYAKNCDEAIAIAKKRKVFV